MEWREFSSHKIVSLDQLTDDVTNLVPPDQKTLKCSKHPAKELDLYCETCKEVICRDCIVKVHRDHQYDLVTEAFPQQKDVLIASVKPAEQQLASVNKALEGLDTLRGKIVGQQQTLEAKIRRKIGLIHEALKVREEELISQLDQMTGQKLKNVAAQQDQLELVSTRLKSYCGFLQESLRTGNQAEVLAMSKSFMQQIQDVTSSFKPQSLVPEEETDLEFFGSDNEMAQQCQQFGGIYSPNVCPAKCSAEGTGLHVAVVGEAATVTVHQKEREYQRPIEVSCELVSCSDGSSRVRGEARRVKDGQYDISYLPQHRGYHSLHLRIKDQHIPGSPFPLSVITTTPTNIISDIQGPSGLAVDDDGNLIVVERVRGQVSIINHKGMSRKSFGSQGSYPEKCNWPCGVALSTKGDILVCNQSNHCINIFSPDGNSVKCLGSKGNGPLQFYNPIGIVVHPHSKKIYIIDYYNHRVQILNENLTYHLTFGSGGSENGQFNSPRDISIDSAGNVYVADSDNHRIQVFTANGEYIRQFGKEGSGEGELNEPKGITIDSNDILYVSDSSNNRISIFTSGGQFLRSFGSLGEKPGQFKYPIGIAVNNGVIYVGDDENSRVQMF